MKNFLHEIYEKIKMPVSGALILILLLLVFANFPPKQAHAIIDCIDATTPEVSYSGPTTVTYGGTITFTINVANNIGFNGNVQGPGIGGITIHNSASTFTTGPLTGPGTISGIVVTECDSGDYNTPHPSTSYSFPVGVIPATGSISGALSPTTCTGTCSILLSFTSSSVPSPAIASVYKDGSPMSNDSANSSGTVWDINASTGAHQYCLKANWTDPALGCTTVTVPPTPVTVTPAPTVSLSANTTSVTSGGSVTLTYSSTNATSCTGTGGGFAGSKTASSVALGTTLSNLTTTTTYGLSCTGAGGTTTATPVTVTVTTGPACSRDTFTCAGSSLSWSTSNCTNVSVTNPNGISISSLKTGSANPVSVSGTYTLTADGNTSTAVCSIPRISVGSAALTVTSAQVSAQGTVSIPFTFSNTGASGSVVNNPSCIVDPGAIPSSNIRIYCDPSPLPR